MSEPVSGNHQDIYQIEKSLDKICRDLEESKIETEGLFLNVDARFDTKEFRSLCE